MGETLGAAGVSIEGGAVFAVEGRALAHFLVADGESACEALAAAGLAAGSRPVLQRCLDQAKPGQVGAIARRLADADVNIEVLYSDHDHHLVLVVDDPATAAAVTTEWAPADEG